ncbi:MAG: hypothetical protein HY651_03920 [Acidobacteria bacterium]|nr:hypothetical protein [Acidobacteriota bacterium]
MKFLTYNPEQADLLPPSVGEVLGEDDVCFLVHRAVERLDLGAFEQGYVEEGRPAYHPALLLKMWLYAYALGDHVGAAAGATGAGLAGRPRCNPRRDDHGPRRLHSVVRPFRCSSDAKVTSR